MEAVFTKLSPRVIDILQRQVKHELENSNLYRSIANYCKDKSYEGFEKFYTKQSEEEHSHYKVFSEYLIDKKVPVPSPTINGFGNVYASIIDAIFISLQREKLTTDMIKQICDISLKEGDFQTFELGLKMVKEQNEEEAIFINLIDRWKLLQDCSGGLFLFDSEILSKFK